MGRHANGDTPTGVLFVKPDDPKFRRAAGGRKTGKIPRIKPPTAESGFLPRLPPPSEAAPAASTAVIPAQRRSPEPAAPRVAVSVSVPPQRSGSPNHPQQTYPAQRGPHQTGSHSRVPEPRRQAPERVPVSAPPKVQMTMRLAPPPMRVPEPEAEFDREPRSLPTWTKICVVLGVVLVLVGFGGLGAAYAVNQQAAPTTAGNELIRR